ncbi:MAG: TonB-dependent receptor plug domain-containing protein [Candidatus Latescibacterota bacterium]
MYLFASRFTALKSCVKNIKIAAAMIYFLLVSISVCFAETSDSAQKVSGDLISLSIEELMDIEVTSVSRKAESLANAAAAVFVITQDDIRRSGVTSIPEALRMVPGLEVARVDANKQAVSSRGFNGRFARKMLVLIDGRTVYTPLFSGVFWDRQNMMLEDIERIEVIRGPGATLWGANAVNGVINIITKKAADTLGGIVTAGGGNVERGLGGARYGAKLGAETNLRVYAKYLNQASGMDSTGQKAADGWFGVYSGFRLDSRLTGKDEVTLQGDMYNGRLGATYTEPLLNAPYSRTFDFTDTSFGGNILSRWERTLSESSGLALQMYYDRTDQTFALIGEERDTIDLDFQHRFNLGERQGMVWGFGYRFTHDRIDNTPTLSLTPDRRRDNLFSAFVQDDITIVPERLRLTLGSKFEHNGYTGFEVQPNVRAIWTPNARNSVWGAVSRAVRTPMRAESDIALQYSVIPPSPPDLPLPLLILFNGSRNLKPEELLAYEFGYRVKPKEAISLDLSAFFNRYDHLSSQSAYSVVPNNFKDPQYLIYPLTAKDKMDAKAYGVELASDWAVHNWWGLQAVYSFLKIKTHFKDNSTDFTATGGLDPRHQVSLRSRIDLGRTVEFDLWLRYVDELPGFDIKSYVTPDVRLSWKPLQNMELSLVGRNLTHHNRLEFKPEMIGTPPTVTERSFFVKIAKIF